MFDLHLYVQSSVTSTPATTTTPPRNRFTAKQWLAFISGLSVLVGAIAWVIQLCLGR
jgi:hypothetical protein